MFNTKDRVQTPLGCGSVQYVRNRPPLYSEPDAVSVLLDSKKGYAGYTGTMFDAGKVYLLEEADV